MTEDLSSNRACRIDLNAHGSHLKDGPVAVFNAVLKELRSSVVVVLVSWVRNPSTVGDNVLSFWSDPDQFGGVFLLHRWEWWRLVSVGQQDL